MKLVPKYPDGLLPIDPALANQQRQKAETIKTEDLYLKGERVNIDRVLYWLKEKTWPPIGVIESNGLYFLVDGIHRCFAALLRGGVANMVANVFHSDKQDGIGLEEMRAALAEQQQPEQDQAAAELPPIVATETAETAKPAEKPENRPSRIIQVARSEPERY